jgi:hypothetical protein
MVRPEPLRARLLWLVALGFAPLCGRAPAAATTTLADNPTSNPYQSVLDQLGADDASDRTSAESYLTSLGHAADQAIHQALTDPRPEVQLRARRMLRTNALFRLSGVPDDVLAIAQAYLKARDFEHRKIQLNRLFQVQPQPNTVLARLITLETDDDLRRQMLYQLAGGYRQAIAPMLLKDDDLAGVLNLLRGSADMWGGAEAADEATALMLSNRLQDQIDICSAEQINGDTVSKERAATQLCFLYRVCRQYDQAIKYARLSHDQALVFLVLQDQGDWSAAIKEPDDRWRDPIVAAGYRAAFQRLAGHTQAGIDLLTPSAQNAIADADATYSPSRVFLLNDLPERGIELLTEQHPAVAFTMRVERGEIAEAIAIAQNHENRPREAVELGQLHDALRQSLGELPEPATQPQETSDASTPNANQSSPGSAQAAILALQNKSYDAAANAFAQLWSRDQTQAGWLYLQGYALQQSGKMDLVKADQGKVLMDQAQLLPLGDPLSRWRFAAELDSAGLHDTAEQQRALGLRGGGSFDEIGFSEIYNTRAANAIERKQWSLAADALDRLCLINLSAQVQWHDPVRLLTIPALAHLVKARDALTRGDSAAVLSQLQSYLQYLPMSSDMVLEMVPALDDLGEHEKANAIFDAVYQKLSALCSQYPKSITYLNQLAWMSACCGRQLDDAIRAAQTTVQLEPNNWQVLDTLAEVRFRRGDRAAAVDIEKRAMTLTSDPYVSRQEKRFETATIPSTTQPGTAPE